MLETRIAIGRVSGGFRVDDTVIPVPESVAGKPHLFQGEVSRLAAWLAECWWAPERYVEDGSAPSPEAFAPCAPGAVRLAAHAVRENWLAIVPVPCETVWDAPVPHLMLALVACSEIDGGEFEAPGEAKSVAASGSQEPGVGNGVVKAAIVPDNQAAEADADDGDGQYGEQQRVLVDPV